MAQKYTYFFGNGAAEGDGKQRELLGGKGANLHEMTKLGCPFRPVSRSRPRSALTIYANNKSYPAALKDQG